MVVSTVNDYIANFRLIKTAVDQALQTTLGPLGRLQVTLKILELAAADGRADRSRSSG